MRSKSVKCPDRRLGEKSGVAGNPVCVPEWTVPLKDWRMAMSRFIIEFVTA